MSHDSCRREALADGPIGGIDLCSCGAIYLRTGPVTVRHDLRSFLVLCRMVEAAQRSLASQAGASLLARPPGGDLADAS